MIDRSNAPANDASAATTDDGDPVSAASTSVTGVVAALQKQVAALRRQNALLTAELRAARPHTSPEDFAAAVQRSVDKLQSQLAAMTNSVSNFAVREFKLETNVQLHVTSLGELTYSFVSP